MRMTFAFVAAAVLAGFASAQQPKVGDTVWAQWQPNQWYHGKIEKKADVGFHVKFDDGDETDVCPALIALDVESKKDALTPGTRVVIPGEGGVAKLATVVKIDGANVACQADEELGDATAAIKDVRRVTAAGNAKALKVDDIVWAQWRPNDWYHGKVKKTGDGGYHVEFDDGDEADLPSALIAIDQAPEVKNVKVGARVIAVFSDGKFYPGTVIAIDKETCKIKYDDGDEADAPVSDVRAIGE